jgi:dienelactone hydrolase
VRYATQMTPAVKQAESDQIVTAMQAQHIPVTYVLYPDEGHGFARPENNRSFIAIAEAFFAKCLGSRCEPIGHDLKVQSHGSHWSARRSRPGGSPGGAATKPHR